MYRDNTERCERVFAGTRHLLSVQEYMLASKARGDFLLLEKEARMSVPAYIPEAVELVFEV